MKDLFKGNRIGVLILILIVLFNVYSYNTLIVNEYNDNLNLNLKVIVLSGLFSFLSLIIAISTMDVFINSIHTETTKKLKSMTEVIQICLTKCDKDILDEAYNHIIDNNYLKDEDSEDYNIVLHYVEFLKKLYTRNSLEPFIKSLNLEY